MRRVAPIIAGALVVATFGCGLLAGIDEFRESVPPAAPIGSPGDGGVTVDAPAGDAVAGTTDAGADAAQSPPQRSGYIGVTQSPTTDPNTNEAAATAAFTISGEATNCTSLYVETCAIYKCPAVVPAATYVSAGKVKVSGVAPQVDLNPNADKTYPPFAKVQGAAFLEPGKTVVVEAEGADVPPFGIKVDVPEKITTSGGAVIGAPFAGHITWSPATEDQVILQIGGMTPQGLQVSVRCAIAKGLTDYQVPGAVIAELPSEGSYTMGTWAEGATDAGGVPVTVGVFLCVDRGTYKK